ncbi:MAG: hypothetical protein J6W03_00415 [Bacteroidaceae bacterium]|nr:hypothetical protein [Bacteroidaceae bacterium]
MKTKRLLVMLLAIMACGIQAWSYRITDNYTIEVKFKINAIGAGIAFAGYEGFNGNIAMWQFSVGVENNKSVLRPHDWRVGGVLLEEKSTGSVTLNTTDWFVTKIVISNDGNHADTYLRNAANTEFTLIDSRDSRFDKEFRFGLVGAREDHDGSVNESATFDYIKVTDNATGDELYSEDFDTTDGNWRNDPVWDSAAGTLTVDGRNLSERRYFPNNMFQDAVDMHYTVEADMTFVNGFASIVFGLDESNGGSNYMWQISPGYPSGDGSIVCNYYHLDNGNENWKAHAKGPDFPGFDAIEFYDVQHHVMIEVKGNVVYTYIDGTLVDTFVQCDMTDLALLNKGKVGLRVDAGNGVWHEVYIDNVKVTEYDKDNNATVKMNETFDGGVPHYFEISGKNATYATVESVDGEYMLHINCDGTSDRDAKVRIIQTDAVVCIHDYANGICTICGAYEEPGYDAVLGAYTIGNLGQLIRFSEIVNGGETGAKGSLTADIDMESSDKFQPIGLNNDGSWQRPFTGTFYGNNHVISNLYVKTECEGGLFSRTRGGKIYNLGLVNGYIESTANLRCGAIAGEHHDNAIIENCYARGTFEFVTNHAQKNAVAGECAGGHFINCYTTLPLFSCDYPMGGDKTNSYEGVTAEQGASGEIAYKLGGAFFQTIGEDAYPELDNTRGTVFAMDAAGYATLYNNETAGTLSSNVAVYTGKKNGSYITLIEQDNTIPAQTAVILKGAEGYYSFTPAASAPAVTGENDLIGTAEEKAATGSEYALAQIDGEVGFYRVNSGTNIPAGKAYIIYTGGGDVKGFAFNFDGATGIKNLDVDDNLNGAIYNVAGQRMSQVQKGINIINGKKVLK